MSEPLSDVIARTVGIDLSLTSTAVAGLDLDNGGVSVQRIRSSGSKDASLEEKLERCRELSHKIVMAVTQLNPLAVAIEGAQFATSKDTSAHRRAGLWWRTVDLISDAGFPIIEVPPTTLKKWATGKGNAGKDMMIATAARRWSNVSQNDEADAAWLADLLSYCVEDGARSTVSKSKARDAIVQKLDIGVLRAPQLSIL
jgi:Holliday junction resolvasome RuvABC endonuclease subunit